MAFNWYKNAHPVAMNCIKKNIIRLIRCYRFTFSVLLPPSCRFHPSCSQYAMMAIHRHGVVRGLWLGTKRVLRCNPWQPGGVDPVSKDESMLGRDGTAGATKQNFFN
jgi:uncharacterized protein